MNFANVVSSMARVSFVVGEGSAPDYAGCTTVGMGVTIEYGPWHADQAVRKQKRHSRDPKDNGWYVTRTDACGLDKDGAWLRWEGASCPAHVFPSFEEAWAALAVSGTKLVPRLGM